MGLFDKARKNAENHHDSLPDVKDVVNNIIRQANSIPAEKLGKTKTLFSVESDEEARVACVCYSYYKSAELSGIDPSVAIAFPGASEPIEKSFSLSRKEIYEIYLKVVEALKE